MKILVVNADCITVNSSANLCHLAYLNGLVSCGYEVTLLSASGKGDQEDPSMKLPPAIRSHTCDGVSLYERLSIKKSARASSKPAPAQSQPSCASTSRKANRWIRSVKKAVLSAYGIHGIYSTFVRKASGFRSEEEYDYILSLSTPVASHLLAYRLLHSGGVKAKQWIQIWEDPWYSDAYGFNRKPKVYREEKRLLSFAQRVCYVSPLTLKNQQRLFPEYADKMYWQPLPCYYEAEKTAASESPAHQYGYFGDYFPEARDLRPFYEAAVEAGISVHICGNPYGLFQQTPHIHIHPRLSLDRLRPIEANTSVLVFLCNRGGGQIPGKLYQYSATDKTILFILDGSEQEQQTLKAYFQPFHRYVFCRNTVSDITRAIGQIESGDLGEVENRPLSDFAPEAIISKILRTGGV